MPATMKDRMRQLRADSDRWLEAHPRVSHALDHTGCLKTDRHAIARGVAAGLFVALTPVFGIQTFLLMLVCVLLHANFPVAFAVSWLSNPFTIGPIVLAANFAGREILAPMFPAISQSAYLDNEAVWQTTWTILGSLLIAIPAALLGYFVALLFRRRAAVPDN